MGIYYELQHRAGQIVLPVICACVFAYFAYHTIQGNRGLFAYFALSQEVEDAEGSLAAFQSDRIRLEHNVALLGAENLDLDLLEERARALLNVVHEDDVLILNP
ncbi:MAG: FtsB family cell division protein [Alphaproteobacteria bacterium]|jgi:cell division protein FtsB